MTTHGACRQVRTATASTKPARPRVLHLNGKMRRFVVPGLIVAAALGLLALLIFAVTNQGTSTSIDSALSRGAKPIPPDAHTSLPVLGAAGSRSLAQFRGKIVVLNVFASWCTPCQAEAPILDREQQALLKHNGTIVGVTYKDDSDSSAAFVRREHITYPVLRDVTGNFARDWGVNGVPETFVINRQGRIVAVRRYQLAGNWLKQTVTPLLAERS
jgi:cytochrome c biogenesis protein CcmG/thiol:disulfide interchange protein DsbE